MVTQVTATSAFEGDSIKHLVNLARGPAERAAFPHLARFVNQHQRNNTQNVITELLFGRHLCRTINFALTKFCSSGYT